MNSDEIRAKLKNRLARTPVRQGDIARQMGMDESQLSRILSGQRPMPEGFPRQFRAAFNVAAIATAGELLNAAREGEEFTAALDRGDLVAA